jgi:cob(I)alamin adenosyltransferase
MKLYTKRGDDGTTGLLGGPRVSKDDPRVHAYGEVDETNAAIGMVLALPGDARIAEMLRGVQSDLFVIGSELATPPDRRCTVAVSEADVTRLEGWIDEATDAVAPLRNFILPGGTPRAAALHLARAVCRRSERAVVNLSQVDAVRPLVIIYMNRLSDLLFALSRLENHRSGVAETLWTAPVAS